MEITSGYRQSRKTGLALCLVSGIWAIATLQIDSVDLPYLGEIPISNKSLHIIFGLGLLYALGRATLEFIMQSDEVRRWSLAQFDYRILFNVCRLTLALLAASTFTRSLYSTVLVLGAGIILTTIGWLVLYVLMMLIFAFKSRKGSVAGAAMSSLEWAILATAIVGVVSFTIFAIIAPPESQVMKVFSITTFSSIYTAIVGTLIIASVYFNGFIYKKVFAHLPFHIVKREFTKNGFKTETITVNPEWIKVYGDPDVIEQSDTFEIIRERWSKNTHEVVVRKISGPADRGRRDAGQPIDP